MHPDIHKLLQVQTVDKKLAWIRRDLDSLPDEEDRRRQRLEQIRTASKESSAELNAAEVESRSQEKGILGADEEIKKLQTRLNTVKNNAEYQATLFQIESVKKGRGVIEEEGVELLERLDGLRERAAELIEKLSAEEATFTKFLGEAAQLREERGVELSQAGEGRDGLVKDIPPDLMQKYTGLFQVRSAEAVCAVRDEVCMGCYTSVTPNDHARLLGATTIVTCGACQRLLYLPEN